MSQSIGRGAAFGPHVAVAYSPWQNRKTVIRAGSGLFYGHVPLLAADFSDNPARLISFFDPTGALMGGPILLRNAYLPSAPEAPPNSFRITWAPVPAHSTHILKLSMN